MSIKCAMNTSLEVILPILTTAVTFLLCPVGQQQLHFSLCVGLHM